MIPGYNHNVKYKDRIFHVQTEDSGVKNPHIITLLYYGGNILESVKSTYAELVNQADFEVKLPDIMQKQHKEVLRGLISGRFDSKIESGSKNAAFLNGPAPLNVAEGSQHNTSFGIGGSAPEKKAAPAAKAAGPSAPATAAAPPKPATPPAQNAQKPAAPAKNSDGSFSTEGSILDAFATAAQTIDAAELLKALDSGDDKFVFGGSSESKKLDDMMLDFLKGV
jgi:hypothetical protein